MTTGLWLVLKPTPPDAPAGPKRIAVLPFENLGSSEDDYFADGITDDVRARLTNLSSLAVIARTSSIEYKRAQTKGRPRSAVSSTSSTC